jgi:hypothetical protein
MIQYIKRYFAVRSYVKRLSHNLVRRFGKKSFYSIEQVAQAVQRGKFSTDFIAYAHAAFCKEADFDAHYQQTVAPGTYWKLRRTIGRRYLYGQLDFDATAIVRRFRPDPNDGDFSERDMGQDYPNP